MDNSKLVTIIVTTYKRPKEMVCRAIKSIVEQTYYNLEIIVVDDSPSTYEFRDDVYRAVMNFSDSRIIYLFNGKNIGACASRNRAILVAKGEFIMYVDDDDEILPTCVEERVKKFLTPQIGLVYSDCYILDENTGKKKIQSKRKYRGRVFDKLILDNFILAFPMMRLECFEKCGLFDVNMPASQDYEMWLRIAEKYEVDYVEKPLSIVHIHNGVRITTDYKKRIRGLELINEKYKDFLSVNRHAKHIRTIGLSSYYACDQQWKKSFIHLFKGILMEPQDVKTNFLKSCIVLKKFIIRTR